MKGITVMGGRYESLEEYCLAVNRLGWQVDFRQLDLGKGDSDYLVAAFDDSMLTRVNFSNRIHQLVMPLQGHRTFGVLAQPQAPGKIGNRPLDADSLLFIDNRHGMDAVIEAGFSGYTLAFSEELLGQLAQLHELPDPTGAEACPGSERQPGSAHIAAIRTTLEDLYGLASGNQGVRDGVDAELAGLVLRAWYAGHEPRAGKLHSRARVRRKALEYIDAHRRESMTVEQLCRASATSMSTLERAFMEHFGVAPKRYLVLSRLSGARRDLLDPTDDRSVTHIANEWGFWHMGKFAADYQKMFGQPPSATRKVYCLA